VPGSGRISGGGVDVRRTKVVTIVGARPQFIKAAAVSRKIQQVHADAVQELLVHTGQHYDTNMSGIFFEELGIPAPAYNLEIAGGSHGEMTGRMLQEIERVLQRESPDWVVIYGDTNSTLAGALAAAKLHIPVAHVESGLRSGNMRMPEEVNRIVADRLSTVLFCPTSAAVENLRNEGISRGVHEIGDVMYDVALHYGMRARSESKVLARLGLKNRSYALATCHRAENTDDPERLNEIMTGLGRLAEHMDVVLPLHPRTRKKIEENGFLSVISAVKVVEPLAFLDMIASEQSARVVVTDSGGVQKEAFFYGVPCVTMRDETEWVETVLSGWNTLAGADADAIVSASLKPVPSCPRPNFYGDGDAAGRVVSGLRERAPV
jgi:UDP-GlcNAc3NAcA epimerase